MRSVSTKLSDFIGAGILFLFFIKARLFSWHSLGKDNASCKKSFQSAQKLLLFHDKMQFNVVFWLFGLKGNSQLVRSCAKNGSEFHSVHVWAAEFQSSLLAIKTAKILLLMSDNSQCKSNIKTKITYLIHFKDIVLMFDVVVTESHS